MLKTTATGLPWSDRDLTRWQMVEDPGLVERSRMGVQQAASPDEPSCLAEGAAQPVGSLRVRGMRALSVWQRDASIAGRDLN